MRLYLCPELCPELQLGSQAFSGSGTLDALFFSDALGCAGGKTENGLCLQ